MVNKKMKFIALFITVILTACMQNTQTSEPPKQNTQNILEPSKQNQKPVKSFTQWCKEKSTLPKDAKYTVKVMLIIAGTQDCEEANQKLSNLTTIQLGANGISNLQPLTSLTNLTELKLNKNNILLLLLISPNSPFQEIKLLI